MADVCVCVCVCVCPSHMCDRCDLIDDVTPSDVARLCSVLSRCKALQPDVFWPALTAHLDEAASVHAPDMDNQVNMRHTSTHLGLHEHKVATRVHGSDK